MMTKQFQKSFTLVEILVYIATLAIIIVAISSFIIWSIYSTNKVKTMREVLYNTRRSIEIMTYEIRKAKSISPLSTTTHLYLENATTTEFYLDSSVLYYKVGSATPTAFTSDKVEVKNLEFKKVVTSTTTPSVQISLKIDYKNPANRPEYQASVSATSTASLRSY